MIAALIINAGGQYSAGTYDVIWSLFLQGLGAGLGLIGLTFAMFGLPILLLSPMAGRLVDRIGPYHFIILGSILPGVSGLLYTRLVDPTLAVPLILIEATGFAMLNPALYAVVAANSPPGRSSTAQGIFGAAGTVGFIIASLLAGVLAAEDILYPFYVFTIVISASLIIGLLVGGDRLRARRAGVQSVVGDRPRRPAPYQALRVPWASTALHGLHDSGPEAVQRREERFWVCRAAIEDLQQRRYAAVYCGMAWSIRLRPGPSAGSAERVDRLDAGIRSSSPDSKRGLSIVATVVIASPKSRAA